MTRRITEELDLLDDKRRQVILLFLMGEGVAYGVFSLPDRSVLNLIVIEKP